MKEVKITDEKIREGVKLLTESTPKFMGDQAFLMYCHTCEEVHIFGKETDGNCIQGLAKVIKLSR